MVILVYKERLVLEGFPVCPGYQDLVVTQDPRVTEVLRVTQVLLELVMKDPQDLRDLMELPDLQVLVSLVLRVSEVLLASKVSECSCLMMHGVTVDYRGVRCGWSERISWSISIM